MTDQNQQQGSKQTTGDNTTVGLVKDKMKTAEQYIREAEATYIIPVLIRENFPDLIKLIVETESMDKEEREYWLSIMPVMTEEQIVKLRDILVNEREQLAQINHQYNQPAKKAVAPLDEAKLKQQFARIKEAEDKAKIEDLAKQEELLKMLESI
jgi:hypothetical protein